MDAVRIFDWVVCNTQKFFSYWAENFAKQSKFNFDLRFWGMSLKLYHMHEFMGKLLFCGINRYCHGENPIPDCTAIRTVKFYDQLIQVVNYMFFIILFQSCLLALFTGPRKMPNFSKWESHLNSQWFQSTWAWFRCI